MTPTELQLLALHRAPTVCLDAICETYLSMSRETARAAAALNRLPFPTFRLHDSRKAPVMVKVSDLAAHIDSTHKCAQEEWRHSQV